ncbi:hypothetical protein D3C86_1778370 [compost metagenome]
MHTAAQGLSSRNKVRLFGRRRHVDLVRAEVRLFRKQHFRNAGLSQSSPLWAGAVLIAHHVGRRLGDPVVMPVLGPERKVRWVQFTICFAAIAVYDALELAARKPPFNVKMSGRRLRSS